CQHVAQLIVKGRGVLFGVEIVVPLSPMRPTSGQPMEDLARIPLPAEDGFAVRTVHDFAVRSKLRNARLSEVFLRKDVHRKLSPAFGYVDVIDFESDGPIRVSDLRRPLHEGAA